MRKQGIDLKIYLNDGTNRLYVLNPKQIENNIFSSYFIKAKKMNENWSIIINLIGKAHDHAGEATEEDYYLVNFEYAKLLFTEFLNSKAKLFIHISSIAAVEEYGTKDKLVEGSTCHPISFYGKSKFAAEKWLLEQQLPFGKQLVILRPPMVHGKGDKGNLGLLYKFIAKGIPYPLTAYENQRSFISIQNFNFFIEQIIKNHTELKLNLYHISDDEALSTKEIIEVISKTLNKKPFNLKVPKIIVNTIAKIGDIIQLKAGEKLGLDGELLSDTASFNTAALTGESKPDTKAKGETVLAGMINLNTVSQVKVTTAYTHSKLSKILEMVQEATSKKAPTELSILLKSETFTNSLKLS